MCRSSLTKADLSRLPREATLADALSERTTDSHNKWRLLLRIV